MRRRLLVARALVHRPRLVLLDEPTVGLDPQVRQELWALIDSLRSEGVSILMSTHYIEEAERLADTVTIMSHGRAVATGKPSRADPRARRRARRSRSTGRPRGWPRSRRTRPRDGVRTRRTGTSITLLDAAGSNGDAPEGAAAARQPGGRLRPADRRGDRVTHRLGGHPAPRPDAPASAASSVPRSRACSFARSSISRRTGARPTFSSTVDPTIYLLAFGFGFGSLVSRGQRLPLRRVRRHRRRSPPRAVLVGVPGDVLDVRQVPVPAHLRRDPGRARRHRGARHRRGALDRDAARASTATCRCSSRWSSGSTRARGCSSCRSSASSQASAGRASASRSPRT